MAPRSPVCSVVLFKPAGKGTKITPLSDSHEAGSLTWTGRQSHGTKESQYWWSSKKELLISSEDLSKAALGGAVHFSMA